MKFSTKSRYALRLMAELARYAPGPTVSRKEISERQKLLVKGIAAHHEAAKALLVGELAEQQHPDSEEDKRWRHPGNQRAEKSVLRNTRDLDAGAVDPLQDRGIHDRRHELALAVDGFGEGAGDGV